VHLLDPTNTLSDNTVVCTLEFFSSLVCGPGTTDPEGRDQSRIESIPGFEGPGTGVRVKVRLCCRGGARAGRIGGAGKPNQIGVFTPLINRGKCDIL